MINNIVTLHRNPPSTSTSNNGTERLVISIIDLFWILLVIVNICDGAAVAGKSRITTSAPADPETKLRLVQLMWRHGDRTPIDYIPSDPANAPSTWPQGPGEITKLGLLQHYQTGQYLRQLYVDQFKFLNGSYDSKEIYVRSTDYNRTIQSAQSNLAGFYPSAGFGVPGLHWYPIPVHSVSDDMLRGPICPYRLQLMDELFQSPEWKARAATRQSFYDWLQRLTKWNGPLNDTNVSEVYDALSADMKHNRTWPSYVNQSVYTKIRDYAFANPLKPYLWEKYFVGLLINEMRLRMAQVIFKTADPRLKLLIYSGHDSTLMPILRAYRVFNNLNPPYTAVIAVELHQEVAPQGRYFVKFLYRNSTNYTHGAFQPLTLPGCGGTPLCPFANYEAVSLPVTMTPDSYYADCHVARLEYGGWSRDYYKRLSIVFFIVSLVLLAACCVACYIFSTNRRSRTLATARSGFKLLSRSMIS